MANTFPRTLRSLNADSSKHNLLVWAIVSFVLLVWITWFVFVDVSIYEVSSNARLEVVSAAHPVSTPISGQVVESSISLGRKVNAGDVLLKLDSRAERLQLAEEQARINSIPVERKIVMAQAKSYEQAIELAGETAKEAVIGAQSLHEELLIVAEFERDNVRRMKKLRGQGQLSEVDLLRARLNSDRSQSAANAQLQEIERLSTDVSSGLYKEEVELLALKREIALLDRQLLLSEANAARLQEEIEKRTIKAPISGEIGSIAQLDVGAVVNVGSVLAHIIPSGALMIVADYPPEHVLGKIHTGQSAAMRLDAFPWAQYGVLKATVERVATEINNGRVRVEFSLNEGMQENAFLQHGLTGSVEVNVETTTPAILVLRSAGQVTAKPKRQPLHVETAMQ